ncbi:Hypothetical predicted protein [Paramuricea clavata]|uniref:Uncharacterized protein n=1 Tax=Paramuricea clavata TaxID=317549 RepID=A0A7D9LHI9_PARCT|nr:Hypothetical predicted protein [Paramuricea clavata]
MKTAVYFCFLLVILIQSVDSLPISCIGGNGCEPTDSGARETTSVKKTENTKPPSTTATGTTIPTTTTVATTTTAATTGNTVWPYWPIINRVRRVINRRVICPPFNPHLDDIRRLILSRILSVKNSDVPTSAKPATKQINYLVTKNSVPTNVPTSAKPATKQINYLVTKFFKKSLTESLTSYKEKESTNTENQEGKMTEISPTIGGQKTITTVPTPSADVAKKPSTARSTTEIPHIFAWILK